MARGGKIFLQCKHSICGSSIHELPERSEDEVGVEEVLPHPPLYDICKRLSIDTKNKIKVQVVERTKMFI
jgi:hypothetical protein